MCINNKYPQNWVLIEESDMIELGKVYHVDGVNVKDSGTFYTLEEKPQGHRAWRVEYNANRFIILPEGVNPEDIKIPPMLELTEEEEFVLQMRQLGMKEEGIQNWLNYLRKN